MVETMCAMRCRAGECRHECHVVVRLIDPELPTLAFLSASCACIFLLDCIYIALLTFVGGARADLLADDRAVLGGAG